VCLPPAAGSRDERPALAEAGSVDRPAKADEWSIDGLPGAQSNPGGRESDGLGYHQLPEASAEPWQAPLPWLEHKRRTRPFAARRMVKVPPFSPGIEETETV
jgi:hypothetical protein